MLINWLQEEFCGYGKRSGEAWLQYDFLAEHQLDSWRALVYERHHLQALYSGSYAKREPLISFSRKQSVNLAFEFIVRFIYECTFVWLDQGVEFWEQ